MGFKEHVGIKVATYFTNLLRTKDDLRKITNQQIDQLAIDTNGIHLRTRFFKSFNRKEIYSGIFTSDKIVILPCKSDWKQEEVISIEKANIENINMEKGKLYGSALRIKKLADILKLEITEKNSTSHKLQIIVDSWEFGEKLTTGIATFLDKIIEKEEPKNEVYVDQTIKKKKSGTIILWDYDNVKLTNKGKLKDDLIGTRISQELNSYQPIIKGLCAFVNPLTKIERNKIDEIDENIDTNQPVARKDAADYVLLEKGEELISKHNPETIVIISGDHIFTHLLKFQKDNDIKIVLFHIGNISNDWLSAGIDIKGIDVSKPDKVKCTKNGCNKSFVSQHSLDQHIKSSHPEKSEKKVICKDAGCNSKFGKIEDMNKHYQIKHRKKN